jgi:hypothetical protein
MACGDPQRTWFSELIQKLRLEWHESMTFPGRPGSGDISKSFGFT